MPYYRRNRFGRQTRAVKPAVTVVVRVRKRRCPCLACGRPIEVGETYHVLMLRAANRVPCVSCSQKPVPFKRYHVACTPADVNKAMGYDPAKAPVNTPPVYQHVAPPPKPPSLDDLKFAALASLEAALMAGARQRGVSTELEKQFKTYQAIKQHLLRPANVNEQNNAARAALKRMVDLAFE